MTTSFDDHRASASDRRGVKLLGLSVGAVLGMSIVALGMPDIGAADVPPWSDGAPALPQRGIDPPATAAEHLAALDSGVDWQRAEVWTEFGPAAVAAYER
jgi:hypothetical protein